jgi:DNA polymerase-3 subunit delta
MQLTMADFLRRAARREFAAGYLLAGNEMYFRDKARQALIEFHLEGDRGGLVEHDLAEVPVRNALDDAASLGLFAGRRVLWLRNAESLLPRRRAAGSGQGGSGEPRTAGKHSAEAIADYFQRPQPASIVLFEALSLDLADRDDARKAESLEKLLPVPSIRIERPGSGEAVRHLRDEAQAAGFTLEQEAAPELVEACGGDLARARMELEKLMLYAAGRGRITATDVQALVPAAGAFTLWEISDAIGDRDAPRALRLVRDMLRESVPALLVTTLIAGQVRKLLRSKEGARDVHPRVQTQARKFTVKELTAGIETLFEADVALRSSPPDERIILERLVIELAKRK